MLPKGKKPKVLTPPSPVYIFPGMPGPSRAIEIEPRDYFAGRKCSSHARSPNRVTRLELESFAQHLPGYRPNMTMNELCKLMGIYTEKTPKRPSGSGKRCRSRARGKNRYTRAELDAMARDAGIPNYKKLNMDQLCSKLNLAGGDIKKRTPDKKSPPRRTWKVPSLSPEWKPLPIPR